MNDHERFSKQMDETLKTLRDAIQRLDVPLTQKDKLSGLVRNLREFAYQAGRAEQGVQVRRERPHPVFRYPKEFGDSINIEEQIASLVLDGLMTDESWHNNSAAHFERIMADGKILLLWIAEEEPAEREDELVPRYVVELAGKESTADAAKQELLSTEDTGQAYRFVRELIDADLQSGRNAGDTIH